MPFFKPLHGTADKTQPNRKNTKAASRRMQPDREFTFSH